MTTKENGPTFDTYVISIQKLNMLHEYLPFIEPNFILVKGLPHFIDCVCCRNPFHCYL